VTAKDVATGKEQKITISGSSGLNKDEVDRMVKDAASHEADDKAKRELIDERNQADSLAYRWRRRSTRTAIVCRLSRWAWSRPQLPLCVRP
jgi:molecular chaperone DnaK (HSP70)